MHLNLDRIFRGPAVWLIAVAWMASHGWFIGADPDLSMATGSRGAWTDEGTLLSQVRNFLNGHGLEMLSSDGLMKAPLFSLIGLVVFEAFGIGHFQARMMVLAIVSITTLFLLTRKPFRLAVTILIVTTFTLLPIHQHSHLALTETVSIACILIAAYRFYLQVCQPKWINLLWVHAWLVLAVLVKIQFVYLLPLPLICSLFLRDYKAVRHSLFFLFVSLVTGILVFWAFKDHWMAFQRAQSGSWTLDGSSLHHMLTNATNYFFRLRMLPFALLGFCAMGFFFWDRQRFSRPLFSLFLFGGVWTLLECHKLTMDYLPVRYMVSFYVAFGLMTAAGLAHVFESQRLKSLRLALIAIVLLVVATNTLVMAMAYQSRKNEMEQVRAYLKSTVRKTDVLAGTWGPSLTWDLHNKVFPVWEGFTRSSLLSEAEPPTVLITEHDFNESGGFFQKHFAMDSASPFDSVRTFKVLDWYVKVCWMPAKNQ